MNQEQIKSNVVRERHKGGLPKSQADYRKCVITMLSDPEWSQWTDLAISQHTGAALSMVRSQRKAFGQDSIDGGNGVVYFIQPVNGGLVKIGFTTSLKHRLNSLQTGSPVKLAIVKTISGCSRSSEKKLHDRFSEFRRHGEWFDQAVLELEVCI